MGKLKRRKFEALMAPMEEELACLAHWVQNKGKRLAILFEGRDTAGKGGAIKAVSDRLNPRSCRVVALAKPSERETSQWYFQRYIAHLPAAGEIVLFDRSWYNRAGVERVMGFCTPGQAETFLAQVPVFERALVDDGILLFKYWLTCDQAKQEERFEERRKDPLKRWKLSPIDLAARQKYADYTKAREAMLKATHRDHAPWTLVDFNDQRRGRLTLVRDLLDRVPDTSLPDAPMEFPPLKTRPKKESFSVLEPIPDFEMKKGRKGD